jgi:predicted nucleic acid-binding protein
MALILDAGPLFALLDRRDADHEACRSLIERTTEPIVIPSPVLPEVDYLVATRLHPGILLSLLRNIDSGALQVVEVETPDYSRILEICERYADSDIGFVDAAVLTIVERLNEPKLATLDHRHFSILRPRHVASLTLLP